MGEIDFNVSSREDVVAVTKRFDYVSRRSVVASSLKLLPLPRDEFPSFRRRIGSSRRGGSVPRPDITSTQRSLSVILIISEVSATQWRCAILARSGDYIYYHGARVKSYLVSRDCAGNMSGNVNRDQVVVSRRLSIAQC